MVTNWITLIHIIQLLIEMYLDNIKLYLRIISYSLENIINTLMNAIDDMESRLNIILSIYDNTVIL